MSVTLGINDVLKYIEEDCPSAYVSVELTRLARGLHQSHYHHPASVTAGAAANLASGTAASHPPPPVLHLLIDGEQCLHRLYGGYFSDWVSGGQWNRMYQYIHSLSEACKTAGIQIVVAFNGGLEMNRRAEWCDEQRERAARSSAVLRHIIAKGTPPPKVLWVPPPCIVRSACQLLTNSGVPVFVSTTDHHQELATQYREKFFDGLVAQDGEYALFFPGRYYSANMFKLTYKGFIETKEYIMDEVAKSLNLNPNRFPVLAALLGNFIMSDTDLHKFYIDILHITDVKKATPKEIISKLAGFVRDIEADKIDSNEAVADLAFATYANKDEMVKKLAECVQYFKNGSIYGKMPFLARGRQVPTCASPMPGITFLGGGMIGSGASTEYADYIMQQQAMGNHIFPPAPNTTLQQQQQPYNPHQHNSYHATPQSTTAHHQMMQMTHVQPTNNTNNYNNIAASGVFSQAHSAATLNHGAASVPSSSSGVPPHMLYEQYSRQQQQQALSMCAIPSAAPAAGSSNAAAAYVEPHQHHPHQQLVYNHQQPMQEMSHSQQHSGGGGGGGSLGPGPAGDSHMAHPAQTATSAQQQQTKDGLKLPPVPPDVTRTAGDRTKTGLMSPWIYQILTQGEIKLGVGVEDYEFRETMPVCRLAAEVYREIRQNCYAVLFNIHHYIYMAKQNMMKSKEPTNATPEDINANATAAAQKLHKGLTKHIQEVPDVYIKEWSYSILNKYESPQLVPAVPLTWTAPTVQRLWFGSQDEVKEKRMNVLLSCMKSYAPMMTDRDLVPEKYLILCMVLRYLLTFAKILKPSELEAFLIQAVHEKLIDVKHTESIQLDQLNPRCILTANLVMRGVEHALFVNDVCGEPITSDVAGAWNYFDGKLFQYVLAQLQDGKNMEELLDNKESEIDVVKKMKRAIEENIQDIDNHYLMPSHLHNAATAFAQQPLAYQHYPYYQQQQQQFSGHGQQQQLQQQGSGLYYYPPNHAGGTLGPAAAAAALAAQTAPGFPGGYYPGAVYTQGHPHFPHLQQQHVTRPTLPYYQHTAAGAGGDGFAPTAAPYSANAMAAAAAALAMARAPYPRHYHPAGAAAAGVAPVFHPQAPPGAMAAAAAATAAGYRARGGKLTVGGQVVSQWAPNLPPAVAVTTAIGNLHQHASGAAGAATSAQLPPQSNMGKSKDGKGKASVYTVDKNKDAKSSTKSGPVTVHSRDNEEQQLKTGATTDHSGKSTDGALIDNEKPLQQTCDDTKVNASVQSNENMKTVADDIDIESKSDKEVDMKKTDGVIAVNPDSVQPPDSIETSTVDTDNSVATCDEDKPCNILTSDLDTEIDGQAVTGEANDISPADNVHEDVAEPNEIQQLVVDNMNSSGIEEGAVNTGVVVPNGNVEYMTGAQMDAADATTYISSTADATAAVNSIKLPTIDTSQMVTEL